MKLTRRDWIRLLLLWLGGVDLRITILAVPPLVPLIHRALHLDEKAVGALVALPVLLLALAAVPGSLLIARLGVRGALMVGLGGVAVFGALRGLGPSAPVLFTSTLLMGVGVAVSQPAFPSLVRDWFPGRIAVATAVYSNGILIGETLPTSLTTPVGALQVAHGDWRWALAEWSVVVLLSGVAIAMFASPRASRPAATTRWWPSWRHGQAVRIGIVMGMASAVYFGTNAYIPDFLDQTGRPQLIGPALALLNGAQLLTAPIVALWPRILTGRMGFIGSSVIMAVAQVGLLITPGPAFLVWTFVLGFAAALALVVVLTLPPRLAAPGDVHRMSAAIFTFQYAVAFAVPIIAGTLWDASGRAVLAFVPGVVAAGVMAWMSLPLKIPDEQHPGV